MSETSGLKEMINNLFKPVEEQPAQTVEASPEEPPKEEGNIITNTVDKAVDVVDNVVNTVIDTGKNIVNGAVNMVTGTAEAAVDTTKSVVSTTADVISGTAEAAVGLAKDGITAAIDTTKTVADKTLSLASNTASGVYNAVKDTTVDTVSAIGSLVGIEKKPVDTEISTTLDGVSTATPSVVEQVKAQVQPAEGNIQETETISDFKPLNDVNFQNEVEEQEDDANMTLEQCRSKYLKYKAKFFDMRKKYEAKCAELEALKKQ